MHSETQKDTQTVAVIVERDGAAKIARFADRMHVWAIETPDNRAAVETVWSRRADLFSPLSMTIFHGMATTPEETVAGILPTIACITANTVRAPLGLTRKYLGPRKLHHSSRHFRSLASSRRWRWRRDLLFGVAREKTTKHKTR